MVRNIIISIVVIMAIGFCQTAYKADGEVRLSPRLLNCQGYLTDTLGNPITNPSISMTFSIFDAVSAGNQKWTETQPAVSVDKGIFHVLLGNVTPIPDSVFNNTNRWLQMSVAGQTLSPRTRIVSTPYAYTATYSDTAQYSRSSAVDNDWIINGSNMYSGVSGNVGIGTMTPGSYKLYVNGDIQANSIRLGNSVDGIRENWWEFGPDNGVGVGIDLHADSTQTDFSARIYREPGDTAKLYIYNVGSGNFELGDRNLVIRNNTNVGVRTRAPRYTFDVNGIICGGTEDSVLGVYGSVLGGYDNRAGNEVADTAATVVGGYGNAAQEKYAFVGGGQSNNAGYQATVTGGAWNTAAGIRSYVGGGAANSASGGLSTISGGQWNSASGDQSTISGGTDNLATGHYGTIGGGQLDTVRAIYGYVGGGYNNMAGDEVNDTAAVVCGGWHNSSSADYSFVGSGRNITASGWCAVVGGGSFNTASASLATLGGGFTNMASGYGSTVGGGYMNIASADYGVVSGGNRNLANQYCATVSGGYENAAMGQYSCIPGGQWDTISANCSFATNYHSNAMHFNSAALTGSTTIGQAQVRAREFSAGAFDVAMDHPDNPMNKILNQYGVSSDELMSIYRGSAVLDAIGRATVNLPDYFDDINRNPMIQLTGVGTYEVFVAEKIKGNRFVIGGKPGIEVYWQVTAERKDIHAEIARIQTPVVQEKKDGLRGHSIDDDAMIGMYDGLHQKNPELFKFKTEEGRKVHEQIKQPITVNEHKDQ